ncbi:threonine synthase [Intestinibacter bartlettii]|uniref:Threonine synthase n=1 Tax=Intestinibacter bartlettii TaxID=261299 RepID=A0ABS6DXW4_9FIRM|nr:threonine synthase [Intestinibacter bartlettii]MBU5336619.1 threonine synthase [Intestinibacter bartlettii]
MYFISTRGNNEKITASQAIIKGLSTDKGLYVPSTFKDISDQLENLVDLDYKELAYVILKEFLTDYSEKELKYCIESAYDEKFDTEKIAPISKVGNDYVLELYHGPTCAFKDMALTIMPYLLKTAIEKNNLQEEVVILTATSGDTGKAALEGFSDVDKIKIVVFFPENGVSPIQKLQMKTTKGQNTCVVGINGNFDDAQTGVKNIFSDEEFNKDLKEKGYILSSANSINIGRLTPQVVYYFYSYLQLVKENEIALGDKINFVVPTGNFGNILAGYYAKKMGLPVNKFICASNDNNVLYDFFKTGVYDRNRELKLTTSPSMDILISSNLERLLFEISNRDTNKVNSLIDDLNNKGVYKIDEEMKKNLSSFYGGYSTENVVTETIKEVFDKYKYLLDTHTAVAYSCYEKYVEDTNDNTKTVIVSTASPYKFSKDVLSSISNVDNNLDDFEIINKLSDLTNTKIPAPIKELKDLDIKHNITCEKDELKYEILKFLGK